MSRDQTAEYWQRSPKLHIDAMKGATLALSRKITQKNSMTITEFSTNKINLYYDTCANN
jgi:hypothetical protein